MYTLLRDTTPLKQVTSMSYIKSVSPGNPELHLSSRREVQTMSSAMESQGCHGKGA